MSAREITRARSFRISGCTCHGIHISLIDDDGEIFARASFSPDVARLASVELAQVADLIGGAAPLIPSENTARH